MNQTIQRKLKIQIKLQSYEFDSDCYPSLLVVKFVLIYRASWSLSPHGQEDMDYLLKVQYLKRAFVTQTHIFR